MITNEERLNLEARIKELEESCRVKDQKFDQLCKDFDARDAELKLRISQAADIVKTVQIGVEMDRLKGRAA